MKRRNSTASAAPARLLDVGMCHSVDCLIRRVLNSMSHALLLVFHPGPDVLEIETPGHESVHVAVDSRVSQRGEGRAHWYRNRT